MNKTALRTLAVFLAVTTMGCTDQGDSETSNTTGRDGRENSAAATGDFEGPGSTSTPSSTASTTTTTAPSTTTTAPAPVYRFPIDPPSAASYQDDHHDYPAVDMFAECGTPVVSPTNGRIVHARVADQWNAADDNPAYRGGLSFAVLGVDGLRYYGSHLERVDVAVGQEVQAGDPIGLVGRSGNAASTPCHLHFGVSPTCPGVEWKVRRGVVWPQSYLDDWAVGGSRSPVEEVTAWSQSTPAACAEAMNDPTAALADS